MAKQKPQSAIVETLKKASRGLQFQSETVARLPLAFAPVRLALSDKKGRELLPMLGDTARLQIVGGLLLALGVLL